MKRSTLKDYLRAEVALMKSCNHKAVVNGYRSCSDFVLKHGRMWSKVADELPDRVKPMQLRQCFRNAATVALHHWHRNELIYCEGYALGLIPMMHAWLVDLQGRVVDPTWCHRDDKLTSSGREYYGIAIKTIYLQERLVKQRHYGLIDCWEERWPMLKDDPKEWRHPINEIKIRTANQNLRQRVVSSAVAGNELAKLNFALPPVPGLLLRARRIAWILPAGEFTIYEQTKTTILP